MSLSAEAQKESMSSERISILLVDDMPLVRQGLRSLLEPHPHLTVVGEASDGLAAVELANTLRPDVIVMDVHISRLDGVEATRRIKAILPHTIVIGLSVQHDRHVQGAMLSAGAQAFVAKDTVMDDLIGAIDEATGTHH